jgi:very-short-patch-repair endonuclease
MGLDLSFALFDLANMEPSSLNLDDLELESQISLLEAFKSWKDCEKGRSKAKGFANAAALNAKRDPHVFTDAEAKAAQIFDSFNVSYEHEVKIQLKDSRNRLHCYKLDFFFPESRIDVEISPDFHKSYKLVAKRDVLRKRLLKRAGIRVLTIPVHVKSRNGRQMSIPDVNRTRKVARIVKEAQKSRSCLTYYV